jgi:hypothetical protein
VTVITVSSLGHVPPLIKGFLRDQVRKKNQEMIFRVELVSISLYIVFYYIYHLQVVLGSV